MGGRGGEDGPGRTTVRRKSGASSAFPHLAWAHHSATGAKRQSRALRPPGKQGRLRPNFAGGPHEQTDDPSNRFGNEHGGRGLVGASTKAENHRYFMMPLEKDPTREVGLQTVTMPPGAGNEFHRHPGEQWTAIQEGEITFTIKGKPRAGAQGRRIQLRPARHSAPPANLSGKSARYIEMRIFDKGVPASEPAP